MVEFQNELYIVQGRFFIPGIPDSRADVFKYNGTNWISATGTGLLGSLATIGAMTIYNNELYVAGYFRIADGNVANHIMKYDGSTWRDVGFGPEYSGGIEELLVHNNKLWAFGKFNTAGNMAASCVAVYDGIQWCALQDTIGYGVNSATLWRDTIYISGGFPSAGGDSNIRYLAKLKNENLYRQCVAVGVKENSADTELKIFPNPVFNSIKFTSQPKKITGIKIYNPLGLLFKEEPFKEEIDVSHLPSGCYFLELYNDLTHYTIKFIKA